MQANFIDLWAEKLPNRLQKIPKKSNSLKVVFATTLLVCIVFLKESTCETRKNVSYFTLKAYFVLEIIQF